VQLAIALVQQGRSARIHERAAADPSASLGELRRPPASGRRVGSDRVDCVEQAEEAVPALLVRRLGREEQIDRPIDMSHRAVRLRGCHHDRQIVGERGPQAPEHSYHGVEQGAARAPRLLGSGFCGEAWLGRRRQREQRGESDHRKDVTSRHWGLLRIASTAGCRSAW